jgi:hypothetical protein
MADHTIPEPRTASPLDRHLECALLRQRGHNGPLVREVIACLSPESRERLYRIIQQLEDEVRDERRKRRQGRFF